jgi:OOP family OmpA-OmpF porin
MNKHKHKGGMTMRRKAVTIFVAIGFLLVGFLATNSMGFETLVEEEMVNVGGTEMQVVKTAKNFIILFDASSSMDKQYKKTDMRKVNAEKKMVREFNETLPELNYMAGLYTYAGGSGKQFLTPYYAMRNYSKAEYAAAIDKLPDVGKGATYLQDGMRELGDILDRLTGRTVVYLFTDGTYSGKMGDQPIDYARRYASKYNVCFYVISSATGRVEKQLIQNVASINECSRAIPFDSPLGKPTYLSSMLWVLEERYVDAFETREVIVGAKLDPILFGFDSAAIRPEHVSRVDALGQFLQANTDAYVILEGFTDSVGPEEYNLGLSRRRAEAVGMHLAQTFNIDMDRIVLQWYGEAAPAASNATSEGRAMNRRVTAILGGMQ